MSTIEIIENEPDGHGRIRISIRYLGDFGEKWEWWHIYLEENADVDAFLLQRRTDTDAAIIKLAADAQIESRAATLASRFQRVLDRATEGEMAPDKVFLDLKDDAQRLADWVSTHP